MKLQFSFFGLLAVGLCSTSVIAKAADCNLEAVSAVTACILDEGAGTTYSMLYRLSTANDCTMARGTVTPNWEFADYLTSYSLESGSPTDRPYQIIIPSTPNQSYNLKVSPPTFVCVKNIAKTVTATLASQLTRDFAGAAVNTTYNVGSTAANINAQLCSVRNIPGSIGNPAWTYDQYAVATYAFNMSALCAGATPPLPVTLISFGGKIEGNSVVLSWKTATEINSKDYEIERSTDGTSFATVGRVVAAGSSTSEQNYSYTDSGINLSGRLYYRLRMNDIDGRFKHSHIVAIKLDSKSGQQVLAPNPLRAGNPAGISISGYSRQNATLSIFDNQGRLIGTKKIQLDEGTQTYSVPNTDHLGAGLYFVNIVTDSGEKRTHKLIVQ